ncbi:carboxypeptidase regulatory-like domain-containing protein [Dethiobacter alkaliphilus]|uniref:Uncharacterized protein n=1 Tax=Dethiobacter alkaliphilus AHT 1 TaxID=555088 RepID=C0GDJ1_DETAL|nr:carboxypeptidase regulatory-like domain-containing protein [Dethiobacter alkaliphilus]EEG78712.1 hypothetical protein DealDRAFT_0642 [Dethiobacter alkaliphilus AHT 1]
MKKKDFVWIAGEAANNCKVGGKTLRGQARNEDGHPIPGAKIDVFRAVKGDLVAETQADANGNYQLELPGGTYLVRVLETKQYQVDAAVAKPVSIDLLDSSILGIGRIRGMAGATVGMNVQKSGRSTGFSRGHITTLGATVNVGFGSGKSARFTNQIITSKMGEPGDSGSLLLNNANHAVGLLFAGGPKATIYHPITEVLLALNVRLDAEDKYSWPDTENSYRSLQTICESWADSLLKLSNVVGVGIGHKVVAGVDTGTHCLTVLVEKKVSPQNLRSEDLVPPFINHVPTDVVESGLLTADTNRYWTEGPQDRKVKMRPAKPGMSIGHYQVSAGTFGGVVYDRESGEPLILSNNHVLANSSNGEDGLAQIGDPILQPGRQDGGKEPDDVIATLYRFHPITFN